MPYLAAAGFAIAGTLLVIFVPRLHRPLVGCIWTFLCLSAVTFVLYRPAIVRVGWLCGSILLGLRFR